MLRTAAIILLSVSTIATAAVGWMGYFSPLFKSWSITDRLSGYLLITDGFVRFSWSEANEPIYLQPYSSTRWVAVRRTANDAVCVRIHHPVPSRLDLWEFASGTFGPPAGNTAPIVRVKGVRIWMGLPMTMLMLYPVLVLSGVRVRRFRHKPGHCVNCEYDLTGNLSGICPECGANVEPE